MPKMPQQRLIDIFRGMTPEEREKYKQTPAGKAKVADRQQEAKEEAISEMYKKNRMVSKKKIAKKTGGKVGSKKKVKKGGAPHNRLY
tara:strand:+ start:211 stop:471 length:261 start_codon:yes stop_codon:yes gene_type:complete